MSRSWPERVRDIVEAINEILEFTNGMTFDQFSADRRTQKAVLANFSIIGEAASAIPDDVTSNYLSIPWRLMRDMRNIVVHVYFGVDRVTVWKTLTEDLPPLLGPLNVLLDSAPD